MLRCCYAYIYDARNDFFIILFFLRQMLSTAEEIHTDNSAIHHRPLTWQFLVTTEGAKCDICVMTIITLARPEIIPKRFRLAMLV